ncbi:MAG: sulfatase [Pirellulaceae bacterium]|nr:sulfatase [Pirellulaceae bacterium]
MNRFFAIFTLTILASPVVYSADKPNLLVIVTDEHNFRTLGCYREQLPKEQAEMWGPDAIVETPHIDRLAHEGVLCTRAYATAPVCTPSRAAMITGRYPHNTGAPQNDMKLRDDIPTLAKLLNANAYQTGFVGKWHLGGKGKPEWAPKVDGGFKYKTAMFNRGHWKKFENSDDGPRVAAKNNQGEPAYGVDGADEKSFATDFLTDHTIQFINQCKDQPFLAVVSYPDPHGPNTVREPYDRMFDDLRFLAPRTYGRDDVPSPGWLGGKAKKHAIFRGEQMSKYFGMVKCIDDNVGRLLAMLEEKQMLDSTIVLLTSDHGDLCYEHDRLNKGNPYEGSARVPMLIRYPSRLNSGVIYGDPMGTVDITPTLLGLAGIKNSTQFEGRDLSELLKRTTDKETGAVTFLRNAGTSPTWLAAVDQRYKLIFSVKDRPWLFDAQEDPDELLNFYGRPGTAAVSHRLAKELLRYTQRTNDPFAANPKIANDIKNCLAR